MRLLVFVAVIAGGLSVIGSLFITGQGRNDQIRLSPSMLYNLSASGDLNPLIDEQDLGTKPLDKELFPPALTSFSPGFENTELYLPLVVIIDFQVAHALQSICLYDTTGEGQLLVEQGSPGAWKLLFRDSLRQFGSWKEHSFEANPVSRYLRLTFTTPGAEVGELLVFGTPQEKAPRPRTTARGILAPARGIPFDEAVGINGFVNDPVEKLFPVAGILREYHRWAWDEGNEDTTYPGFPDNAYAFAPSWARGKHWSWNFDRFYEKANKNGLAVSPSLGGCAPYLRDFDSRRSDDKPVLPGADPLDPESYAPLADYAFQYAARYGSQPVADSLLKLAPDQPRRSGLGLIRYLEDGNEPDRWWQGPDAYHSPVACVARLSAFFDGHGGALGPGAGAKSADPNLPVVMGGLARPDTNYLRAMLFWANHYRADGSFPADVINLHHYCNTGGDQWAGDTTRGQSPEADGLLERLQALDAYRDRHFPDKELWLSEFGYDTNPVSPQRAAARENIDAEEMQARWLVRSLLISQAAGFDRAFIYMLRDVSAESTTRYNSSGLTRELWHQHEPKTSWYYVSALRNALTGYRFDRILIGDNPDLQIYRFVRDEGRDTALVLWSATEQESTVDVAGLSGQYPTWMVRLQRNSRTGLMDSPFSTEIEVSGRPVIVGFGTEPLQKHLLYFGSLPEKHPLVDEPIVAGNPDAGRDGDPKSAWKVPWGEKQSQAVLDLGTSHRISDIWLYDDEGSDTLVVEMAPSAKGPFREIDRMHLNQYHTWRRIDGTGWTAGAIRFTLTGGAVGEVVLYVD